MAYEAYWDDVVLALRCDGTLPIIDDKGNTVVNSAVTLSSAASDSGGVSARFAAANSRLHIEPTTTLNLGAGDFTIFTSFQVDDHTGYRTLLDIGSTSAGESTTFFIAFWSGFLRLGINVLDGAGTNSYTSGTINCGPVSSNLRHRLLVARQGTTLYVLLDGALRLVLTDVVYDGTTDPIIMPNMRINIGNWRAGDDAETPVYIDEVYIVKGVALETAPYTPAPLFVMGGGGTTGPSTLPIAVAVLATGASTLPIVVSAGQSGAASLAIDVAVVDADYLSGATLASDGGTEAGAWSPVVVIGGVDRTDDIVGDIDIDAGRGAARIASFALKASGVINPTALVGQRVSIDIATAAGGNRMRLFSGRINEPRLDMVGKTVAITCTDDLQNVINGMPRAALDALIGGRWSPAVFDKGASSWVYAQDRLSTVAASLDLSPWGAVRVTPWAAGSVDLTFDGDTVLGQSVEVSLAARAGLVNEIAVDFGYRFPMAKREGFPVHFEYLTNGFGPWLMAGNGFLMRSAVISAIEGAGGAIQSVEWVPMPPGGALYVGGGGVVAYVSNPILDPMLCLGFDAVVTFDYTQNIDELHKITVRSPASVAAMGALRQTLSGSLRGETVDTLAAETNAHLWGLGLSNIPPVDAPAVVIGQTAAEAMVLTADTNRAAAEAALATLVEVAKVKIIASHMDTTVSAAVPLHPLIDLDKTITIDDQGVLATGRVSRVRHSMSPSESARAVTEFEISLCRLSGIGIPDVETPTSAPEGVADGPTGPLAPVVCTFNGLLGQDQSFEITFPAVEASQREAAEVVIDSAFDVALVEDVLTIDMGA